MHDNCVGAGSHRSSLHPTVQVPDTGPVELAVEPLLRVRPWGAWRPGSARGHVPELQIFAGDHFGAIAKGLCRLTLPVVVYPLDLLAQCLRFPVQLLVAARVLLASFLGMRS